MYTIGGRLDCVKNKLCVAQVLKLVSPADGKVFHLLTIGVQYLLLTGQYLQGTQRSVEAWTVHGLAVKGALQLGLHSTAASIRFSSLDQEFRKRTWYGCVVLDRTLSMTFGRPAAIPDDYIRMPLPQSLRPEGNCGDHELVNDLQREVSVAFFNATM
jgi:hypothetical protein